MRSVRWLGMLAATAILGTACQPPTQGQSQGLASPTPCRESQTAPQFAPSAPSNRILALIQFKGSQQLAVRDFTDILNPVTVSKLDHVGFSTQFVSSTDLSYFDEQAVVRMPLVGSPRTVVTCKAAFALAWTAGGTAAAYVTRTDRNGGSQLHGGTGAHNRAPATITPNPLTAVPSPPSPLTLFLP